MEENNNKEPSMKKTKNKKVKVAIITVSIIAILLGGLQVYATTNNYGNVFFMIKNLITTGQLFESNIVTEKLKRKYNLSPMGFVQRQDIVIYNNRGKNQINNDSKNVCCGNKCSIF